jgi:hypothetical protein
LKKHGIVKLRFYAQASLERTKPNFTIVTHFRIHTIGYHIILNNIIPRCAKGHNVEPVGIKYEVLLCAVTSRALEHLTPPDLFLSRRLLAQASVPERQVSSSLDSFDLGLGGNEMDSQGQNVGWALWGRWLLATIIGWVVGIVIAIVLSYTVVNLFHPEETNLIVGLCVGAAVSSAQLVAVRRVLPLKWVWLPGAIVGMGVPYTVAVLFSEAWFGAVQVSGMWLIPIVVITGALAGLIQVGALKRHTRRAYSWIWVSVVTWGVTWLVSFALREPGLLVGVLVHGSLSGSFLIWLVRTSPSREAV